MLLLHTWRRASWNSTAIDEARHRSVVAVRGICDGSGHLSLELHLRSLSELHLCRVTKKDRLTLSRQRWRADYEQRERYVECASLLDCDWVSVWSRCHRHLHQPEMLCSCVCASECWSENQCAEPCCLRSRFYWSLAIVVVLYWPLLQSARFVAQLAGRRQHIVEKSSWSCFRLPDLG